MEVSVSNTIQLFITLLFLTIVVVILGKRIADISKDSKTPDLKVHLLYFCIIASLIIISLVTYICVGNYESDKIIEYISFSGTLSSLILSVVAIIFTIVLSKTGAEQNEKMNEAIIKLKETITDFQEKSKKLDSIANKLEKIERDVDETKTNVSMFTVKENKGTVAQASNTVQNKI